MHGSPQREFLRELALVRAKDCLSERQGHPFRSAESEEKGLGHWRGTESELISQGLVPQSCPESQEGTSSQDRNHAAAPILNYKAASSKPKIDPEGHPEPAPAGRLPVAQLCTQCTEGSDIPRFRRYTLLPTGCARDDLPGYRCSRNSIDSIKPLGDGSPLVGHWGGTVIHPDRNKDEPF